MAMFGVPLDVGMDDKQGGGFMEGMGNLFKNKLFQQYLSAAGEDIASGGPIGTNVNAVTQQNIRAQSMMGLLQKMLGGEFAEGAKMTSDAKGTKFEIPSSALKRDRRSTDLAMEGSKLPGGSGTDWTKVGNPFASSQSGISGADLAGLTTGDISQALQFKFAQDELGRKKLSDIVDMIYKGSLMDYYGAMSERARTPKDERTAAVKNYEYAQEQGYKGSFAEFEKDSKTTHQKDYKAAVEGGYEGSFHDWMLEMAKAGAIQIGEIVSREKAKAELKGQTYFKNPDWTGDLSKHLSSDDVQNEIFQSDTPELTRTRETVKFIENKIIAGGGSIENVEWAEDGQTMIWTVKWSSGDVEEIRYGVRS